MPSVADILATFPEAAALDPTTSAIYVSLADTQTAVAAVWGGEDDIRNLAVALRAAAMMADLGVIGGASASGGAVSSERIGSLSISYATPSGGQNAPRNAYWARLTALEAAYIITARTSYDG